MPQKKMGRPVESPTGEKRDQRLYVNLSRSELRALERVAGEQSPAAYVRDLVLRHLARKKR